MEENAIKMAYFLNIEIEDIWNTAWVKYMIPKHITSIWLPLECLTDEQEINNGINNSMMRIIWAFKKESNLFLSILTFAVQF